MLQGRLVAYLAYSKVSTTRHRLTPPGSLLWHFRFTNRSGGLKGHCRMQVWVQVQVQVLVQVQVQVQYKEQCST